MACARGKYKISNGSQTCDLCPMHTYSGEGSGRMDNCTCNKGYTGADGGACEACVAGTFKDVSGSAQCKSCEMGKFSIEIAGSTDSVCRDCPVGTFSDFGSVTCTCNFGYWRPTGGVNECMACDSGTYKHVIGSHACLQCPEGKFSPFFAAVSNETCQDCPDHMVSGSSSSSISNCKCKMGYTGENGQICRMCAKGTYKDVEGAGACSECPPGKFSAEMAQVSDTACMACPPNSQSTGGSTAAVNCTCNRGYTGPNGLACVPCGIRSYKDVLGSTRCRLCQAGKQGSLGNAARDDCVADDGEARLLTVRVIATFMDTFITGENLSPFQSALAEAALVDPSDVNVTLDAGRRVGTGVSIIGNIETTDLDAVLKALTMRSLNTALKRHGLPVVSKFRVFELLPPPPFEFFDCGIKCVYGVYRVSGIDPEFCNATCGDGMRSLLEECDDGNVVNGDGCSDQCIVEETGNLSAFWDCQLEFEPDSLKVAPPMAVSNSGWDSLDIPLTTPLPLGQNASTPTPTPTPQTMSPYPGDDNAKTTTDGSESNSTSRCMRDRCRLQVGLSVASARQTAQVVSAVVSTTIATVATGVFASSVAGAMSDAEASAAGSAGGAGLRVGAGGGAGAGELGAGTHIQGSGAGMGPVFSMVRQVSFLSIVGRMGGPNASASQKHFSSELDWINFEAPFDVIPRANTQAAKTRRSRTLMQQGVLSRHSVDSEEDCDYKKCGNCVGIRFVERVVTCAFILGLVGIIRLIVNLLYLVSQLTVSNKQNHPMI